jgi:hypothetical protein
MTRRPISLPGWRSLRTTDASAALPTWIAGLPVYRLAQSFEQETRPRELGLVLILASERELRRARLRRILKRSGLTTVTAIAIALMASRIVPAASVPTGPVSVIAQTLSERLEVRPIADAALPGLRPAALRLDGALRPPSDRGY